MWIDFEDCLNLIRLSWVGMPLYNWTDKIEKKLKVNKVKNIEHEIIINNRYEYNVFLIEIFDKIEQKNWRVNQVKYWEMKYLKKVSR
jgi:hypothetical protein